MVCALEPKECSTLFNNGRGTHRIEGIGDKMVTLIHNVLTTDYVALIHDDDCVMGLELLERAPAAWWNGSWACLRESLDSLCGACSASRESATSSAPSAWRAFLDLGPEDNVVTIATDGFDRYPSVLAEPRRTRRGPLRTSRARRAGSKRSSAAATPARFWTCARAEQKERLFAYKEEVWTNFGYSPAVPGQHEVAIVLGCRIRQNPRG